MIARVSEATLKNIGKYIIWIHNKWWYNHNKMQHNKTVCIFCQIYCIFFIWYGIYCLIVTYVFYISSIFRVSSLQFHTSGIALLILTIFLCILLFYWIVAIDIYPIILAQCTYCAMDASQSTVLKIVAMETSLKYVETVVVISSSTCQTWHNMTCIMLSLKYNK